MTDPTRAHPPETTEGWYVFHQVLSWDRLAVRAMRDEQRNSLHQQAAASLEGIVKPATDGWSAVVPLIGSRADALVMHFRPTLDDIGAAQQAVNAIALFDYLRPEYTFLGITEVGLYHASAELAKEALDRRGTPGDETYRTAMASRVEKERANPHVHRRLFPTQPADMPYVCFYPMSKRRAVGQNWYALSLEERSRLMLTHGLTGRGYAGRVSQVISGAIGLDNWEWGVTLFATDPLQFKKIVTDMRFDEVSAQYADFGDFYVGKTATPKEWLDGSIG